jgi:hypothetical protein
MISFIKMSTNEHQLSVDEDKLIQYSINIGSETVIELQKQNEFLESSVHLLEEAEDMYYQSYRKIRGMTWWGSFVNFITYPFVSSASPSKTKNIDVEMGCNEDANKDEYDQLLDVALSMKSALQRTQETLSLIDKKVEKLDSNFSNLQTKMNDLS